MEPLASKIRPKTLDEFIGQKHLVGKGKPLRKAMETGHIFSFVLWGPPGVGKTTLAKIYANVIKGEFYELSAVSAGKEDIRKIVQNNPSRPPLTFRGGARKLVSPLNIRGEQGELLQKTKVLFLDEIHRFNKAQQDYLLPFVERGDLVLIGATTENPSFEVIAPLLSRLRVFVLEELSNEDIVQIVKRALSYLTLPSGTSLSSRGEGNMDQAIEWLVNWANGDARQAITMIENTANLYDEITVDTLKDTLQSKFLRYDKKGDEHYNTISAYIKSMRASQPDAALYYLARMIDAGEDPKFIARRMVVFASEDIGMAQPTALVVANEVFRAVETIGLPEAQINLAHGTVYMALSKKDKGAYEAYYEAVEDVKKYGNLPVPLKIRNAPTKLMKDLGYHKGYERYTREGLLPEKLKGKKYFKRKPTLPKPKV